MLDVIKRVLHTGHIGDGKIFVYGVEKVFKVRTGEEDLLALTDREEQRLDETGMGACRTARWTPIFVSRGCGKR